MDTSLNTKQIPLGPGGHPWGLYQIFMVEMWERFSFYGMRALLTLYMVKGFLGYGDSTAYSIYAAYGALVYCTPYFGGMIADRYIGQRNAVIFGGILMALGHLLMTAENEIIFFTALAFLIAGNGFFKPNISSLVGELYPTNSTRRDSGYTIYYLGINLGAALAPIACGYIGETYGWHYGFGLATIGMIVGVIMFIIGGLASAILVGITTIGLAGGLVLLPAENDIQFTVRLLLAIALSVAGYFAAKSYLAGKIPDHIGRAPRSDSKKLMTRIVILTGISLVAITAMIWSRAQNYAFDPSSNFLYLAGIAAALYLFYEAFKATKVERERLFVVFTMIFFAVLFWAFFDQAGTSINLFTDRNVDRSMEHRVITAEETGTSVEILLTQEQIGYTFDDDVVNIEVLDGARIYALHLQSQEDGGYTEIPSAAARCKELAPSIFAAIENSEHNGEARINWPISEDDIGMGVAENELRTSEFQAVNPLFILIFGLPFAALWTWMGSRKMEPSTPTKFAFGILQLGLGFGVLWYGAENPDARGMVALHWLMLGYLLHTTGELCLSPVGLSMVTKLSPPRIVGTVMGAWFLATAFSHHLAGIIASFTAVDPNSTETTDMTAAIPLPTETLGIYGEVFGQITLWAIGSAIVCFLLVPLMKKWLHPEVE